MDGRTSMPVSKTPYRRPNLSAVDPLPSTRACTMHNAPTRARAPQVSHHTAKQTSKQSPKNNGACLQSTGLAHLHLGSPHATQGRLHHTPSCRLALSVTTLAAACRTPASLLHVASRVALCCTHCPFSSVLQYHCSPLLCLTLPAFLLLLLLTSNQLVKLMPRQMVAFALSS